jgi:hypothetical protein
MEILTPHVSDEIERTEILSEILKKSSIFEFDLFSRQVVIQKKYQNNDNLAACIPYIQFIIRKFENKKILKCYVVFRSQNIDNFLYDNQSLLIYSNILASKFSCDKIFIDITVVSFHKYI